MQQRGGKEVGRVGRGKGVGDREDREKSGQKC